MLRLVLAILALCLGLHLTSPTQAQETVWIQIEAKSSLAEAEDRARAWTAIFDGVNGFVLTSGWHVITLGPFPRPEAEARLAELQRENLVPADSFIADGATYRGRFWPAGAIQPDPAPAPTTDAAEAPALGDETPEQARQSESGLTQAERELIQTALAWFGHYSSTVDGAFGRGTRASMTAWQEAMGYEPTGILTTLQRNTLVANYQTERDALGLSTVTEAEAGIELTLPTALLQFDQYEPPFVHFTAKDGSDALRITLISQPGDQSALYALYDTLQSLQIMPPTGPRDRGEGSFTLRGESATVTSEAYAELSRGLIKGWIVSWTPGTDLPVDRILAAVKTSFRGLGDRALDPGIVPMDGATKSGLLSGLDMRKPRLTRSGFYIDGTGRVLTTADAVAPCGRITLDGLTEARVALTDAATGLALLAPATPLAPPAIAEFQLAPDRIGAELAVSGYSYGDALPAPVLTFGTLAATEGLDGQQGVKRLALTALPGDAGGPVLDATGGVLGMLLPPSGDKTRLLPQGVSFAATGSAIAAALQPKGITLTQSARQGALPPEDLAKAAAGMTVLVSCWD